MIEGEICPGGKIMFYSIFCIKITNQFNMEAYYGQ